MKRQCAHDKICFIWTQGTFALQCQSQKKNFSALQASIWSKNRGAPSPPLPWIHHCHWEHFGVWKITNSNSEQFLLPLLHFCKEKKSVTQGTILTKSPDLLPSGVGILFSIARILLNPLLPADKSSGYLTSEESSGILDRRMLALPEA